VAKYLLSILLAFLMLLLSMGGLRAQSGSLEIPSNTFLNHNLGPGPGALQIPPPGPGVTRLYVGLRVRWHHALSVEVGPLPGQTTCDGFTQTVWTRTDYWTLTGGLLPQPSVLLAGQRVRPANLTLTTLIPPGSVWDGVLDWQGPTANSIGQLVQSPFASTVFTLNTLTPPFEPDRDLWLKVKTSGTPGAATVTLNGISYVRLDSPWSATIEYQYLP